ncbi:PAS domain-containing sensor histidine kinase [Mesorhizobium sp. M7A.F.Ca.CA.001.07.2.1]|uniref:hybrid sensor histidine kinase/response regulator n=2 Tax=Phyllobacteriaceae TaxID=69277 RepID=UPI000FC9F674|nr:MULTISPECIES: PAS domain-containing sensor histidine kinase [Mesorhizobium]RUX99721.1 PAS domain-containing sensor histidine kinase [Mesorhizobium sp. M7A.F.Ca.CA.004.04.1.1]RVB48191.1 PAS domain-containing sensor histidine kinase [Mesorhizobium sp. M7A.F.Ca.CA.004.05.1.1]RVC30401.1 PAS domain-containing sensor histidine kinase [Mesorhizobium sp. M7A.F.Ca.CA.004.04.2.1]MCF6127959.1 PAS domain S-box protein [Mesorhizobium ciceri]MCQ8817748.1 PAS domain S-box protein [Mesorhizobium sp. SEMIA3
MNGWGMIQGTVDKADEDRYRVLVEAVTDYAIYMLNRSGTVTSWNAGAERFKGYSASEIIGQHFSCFYTQEDREAGLPSRTLETAARNGKFETEGWRVRRDGSRFWAHVVVDPIFDPSGKLTGFAKVTRDLTERKKAEDEIRRGQEQFQRLVQGVTDYAIYMLDPEGVITSWNSGAERIKGYSADEIVGKHFSQFYTPEDRERGTPQSALEIAAREGRVEREGWRIRKDGTAFWSHVVIDAIRHEDGELLGFAKVTRDITERKKAQESLDQAREALFQSQKMDAIGKLTGGVAHDFNNLLMAVLGSLELLRKRLPDDPQLLRLLDNAVLGARRGASLTQRMLAFARRQQLDPKPVDLIELIHGMKELLERSLGSRATIETKFPLSLDHVMVDESQIELALLNLCVNARDAMPDGGTIVISTRMEQVGESKEAGLAPGPYVCLSVADAGEGMDEETLARATEPFFTTKGVGKGTGLGLSMVHGMTEQMGGRLTLRSRKGAGTTAELWLPVATASSEVARGPDVLAEEAIETASLRILAVDDDALVLLNTAAMLEDLGHTVAEAHSAAAALRLLEEHPFDLVITDHAMPKMTGLQLSNTIKVQWPHVPVIIATGYAELPGTRDIKILSKPFTEEELANAIATANVA